MPFPVAIVGSVFKDNPLGAVEARKIVAKIITQEYAEHGSELVIVSGGADGVDTFAEEFAKWNGIATEIFLPENPWWSPNGYKERNIKIAEACVKLYRVYDINTKTWGSGFTRHAAEIKGKIVVSMTVGVLQAKWKCKECGDQFAHFRVAKSETAVKHHVYYMKASQMLERVDQNVNVAAN